MKSLVPVVDQVGARIAIALSSAAAGLVPPDRRQRCAAALNAFGNLFGILGNIIKMNQG